MPDYIETAVFENMFLIGCNEERDDRVRQRGQTMQDGYASLAELARHPLELEAALFEYLNVETDVAYYIRNITESEYALYRSPEGPNAVLNRMVRDHYDPPAMTKITKMKKIGS
jgi:hypothetical protein